MLNLIPNNQKNVKRPRQKQLTSKSIVSLKRNQIESIYLKFM